jgi:hypothetical protein
MELASMLAGEEFSDHPRSVCPIIAAFLRAYNDAVEEEPRQDLYRYAAEVVGSRSGADVIRARTVHLSERAHQLRVRRRRRVLAFVLAVKAKPSFRSDLSYTVRALTSGGEKGHESAMTLVDELLAISGSSRPAAPSASGIYAISMNNPTVTDVASSSM